MSSLLTATPGQTIGPFYGYALPFDYGSDLVPPGSPDAIQFHGVVTDGEGNPVPDALLEIWQADADGEIPSATGSLRRDGWTFTGWGRGHRRRRPLQLLHGGARIHDSRSRTVLPRHHLRPWAAQPAVHPGLPALRPAGR